MTSREPKLYLGAIAKSRGKSAGFWVGLFVCDFRRFAVTELCNSYSLIQIGLLPELLAPGYAISRIVVSGRSSQLAASSLSDTTSSEEATRFDNS